MDLLDGIDLNEEQSQEFIKRLSEWKSKILEQQEKELEIFQEEIEQEINLQFLHR